MRSGSLPALPPLKPGASGSSRLLSWRSPLTPCAPAGAPRSTPRVRARGPLTHKTPEALATVQATCRERLQRVLPPDHARPRRVLSRDERRVGLPTVRRRRLTAQGIQPVGVVQQTVEWFYVHGAVAPTTGARFFLGWPSLNADAFHIVVDTCAPAFPDSLTLLLLANSGAHTAQRLQWPDHVRYVRLPPSCPELNPIESVWRDLKDDLAWLQFPHLEAQPVYRGAWLQPYAAPALQALAGDAYVVEAIHALGA
jgi:hypothetical protein